MFHFGSSSREERFFAIYDITSTSVGVGIVWSNGVTEKTVWSKRVVFGHHSTDDYNRYVRTMYATLLEMGMKMISEGFKSTTEVYPVFSARKVEVVCILGQPWFMGAVSSETYAKEVPFQITAALLEEMQSNAVSRVLGKQENLSWQELMGTTKLLEAFSDLVQVEGYPVQTCIRRTAKELQMHYYFGIVSSSVQEHIDEVLKRVLPNHAIHFVTSTRLLSFFAGKRLQKQHKRSVLVEISGEITSISILKNGALVGMSTIPQGTNHILKTIAPNAMSAEEAQSTLDVFRKKNLKNDFDTLPSETKEALMVWKEECFKSVTTLSAGVTPPFHYAVIVETPWYLFYKLSIEKPSETGGGHVPVDSEVIQIEPKLETVENKDIVFTQDMRITLLTSLLLSCTEEKGMCYTENNK